MMAIRGFNSENISWKVEPVDLAPAIVENFINSDRATDDSVDIFRWFTVSINLVIAIIIDRCTHQRDGVAKSGLLFSSARRVPNKSSLRGAGVKRTDLNLSQHG